MDLRSRLLRAAATLGLGLLLAIATPALWVARAQDRPTVEVTPGEASAFRLAVQEFLDPEAPEPGGRAGELRLVIEDALRFSASLKPLDRDAYLGEERTSEWREGLRSDCNDWSQSGAQGLVEGRLERVGERLAVDFRVWDTARCNRLLHKRFEGSWADLSQLGREVADWAAVAFTGVAGVASTEIAFVSDRSGYRQIYVMDADGSRQRPATQSRSVKSFPHWIPSGEGLVYTSQLTERQPALYLSSRGGLKPGRILGSLLEGAPMYRAVFHPSGDYMALVTSVDNAAEIFSVRRDGAKLKRLTHNAAIDISPSWSPDGDSLAFVSDRSGSPQVYVMDRNGRNTRRLTFQGNYNTAPAWSPDGRWIAYESRLESQFDIWLVDPQGEVNFPLVDHPRNDESPAWAPNSRKLAFSSDRRGRKDIYTVDLNGGALRRLTSGQGDNLQPTWGPFSGSFALNPRGGGAAR